MALKISQKPLKLKRGYHTSQQVISVRGDGGYPIKGGGVGTSFYKNKLILSTHSQLIVSY